MTAIEGTTVPVEFADRMLFIPSFFISTGMRLGWNALVGAASLSLPQAAAALAVTTTTRDATSSRAGGERRHCSDPHHLRHRPPGDPRHPTFPRIEMIYQDDRSSAVQQVPPGPRDLRLSSPCAKPLTTVM